MPSTENSQQERSLVVSIADMDDDQFCSHMNRRHKKNMGGLRELWVIPAIIGAWRMFHDKLHELLPGDFEHDHESQ